MTENKGRKFAWNLFRRCVGDTGTLHMYKGDNGQCIGTNPLDNSFPDEIRFGAATASELELTKGGIKTYAERQKGRGRMTPEQVSALLSDFDMYVKFQTSSKCHAVLLEEVGIGVEAKEALGEGKVVHYLVGVVTPLIPRRQHGFSTALVCPKLIRASRTLLGPAAFINHACAEHANVRVHGPVRQQVLGRAGAEGTRANSGRHTAAGGLRVRCPAPLPAVRQRRVRP